MPPSRWSKRFAASVQESLFSSLRKLNPKLADRGVDPRGVMMLYMDPPKHTRYRKIVMSAFTPRVLKVFEATIKRHATEIVDEIAVALVTERSATRGDDRFSEAAMEDRKKEGIVPIRSVIASRTPRASAAHAQQ